MNIIWFRGDIRLLDNRAFGEAILENKVLAIYILNIEELKGAASKCWLHHSLSQLNKSLGNNLHFFTGNSALLLPQIAKTVKAESVFWNNCYEPPFIKKDKEVEEALQKIGATCHRFDDGHLWKPAQLLKADKTPYKIFTPYLKASLASEPPPNPLPAPKTLHLVKMNLPGEVSLEDLNLLPKIQWYKGMEETWEPGEAGAQKLLKDFIDNKLPHYAEGRNFPAQDILSRLSPHLHFGEISPATIWHAVQKAAGGTEAANKFLAELTWRDFAYNLLYHFPQTATESYSPRLKKLKWNYNEELLKKWQGGQTGFPIVDAGMRQLWQTGYMHNRLRMITASFLCKNLLMDWRIGADWFYDCLVDADLAVNTMNWQWVAGTGLDAAPFFRIFNPILQSKKYDADGTYIKTWVPELAKLPKRFVHEPWKADPKTLEAAGIELGKDYPKPCIGLEASVKAALKAFKDTTS